jgi:pimeloyl-ACP methyl ester carboxylesterase
VVLMNRRLERDPCGFYGSTAMATLLGPRLIPAISVPVLLFFGAHDALFPSPAGEKQKALYTGSRDVTLATLPDAGHTPMNERSAPDFRATLSAWLSRRGF